MLDFDASKLLIIGVVALVVIGPKDLPRVLRQVGQAVTKLRRMASEFQGQFMDAMKEADLEDLKAEVSKLKDSATLDVKFDPVADVRQELSGVLEPAAAVPPVPDPVADASHTLAHEAGATGARHEVETQQLALEAPSFGPAAATPEQDGVGSPTPSCSPSEGQEAELRGTTHATLLGDAEPIVEAENAAFRTTAETAGGIGAPVPPDLSRRRRIVVPKRRAPGDRLDVLRAVTTMAARRRPILPPRRDDPRT